MCIIHSKCGGGIRKALYKKKDYFRANCGQFHILPSDQTALWQIQFCSHTLHIVSDKSEMI